MSGSKKSPKSRGKRKKPLNRGASSSGEEKTLFSSVPEHGHCVNCGISIPPGKETCTDKCQQEWDRMLKRKKLMMYAPIIGSVLLILFLILIQSGG